MSHPLAKLTAAAGLLVTGGLGGAALTAGSDLEPKPTAAAAARPPVEVRTVVVRRTVHVYRKPKHPRRRVVPAASVAAAPAATGAPVPVAPAPVRVVAPAVPVQRAAPLETRTSGSRSRGGEHEADDDGRHESEHGDD